ncbi:MAG: hypothetical protein ABI834_03870 [Ginsengibacter sp.]
MQNFKERLYNYEVSPPMEVWDNISSELDSKNSKLSPITRLRRRPKYIFYGLTAAASLVIIFLISVLYNKSGENINPKTSPSLPLDNIAAQKVKDSLNLNNKTLEAIIKSSKDKNLLTKNYESSSLKLKKYITIEGPEGQPVKISSKVATLIESANNEYPPKPVWNKKIEKWKQIMLSSTFSTTSTSLLDIARLSAPLDNNE